jgi:plastocyanin
VALLLVGLLAGCTEEEPGRRSLYPTTGPYVVTAIDYHFHDAHPSLPIPADRVLEFSNQGRNPHNVTIPGFDVDRTFRPGERFSFDPVGSVFPAPGRYPFYCKLHRDRGMSGVIVVAG